MISSFGAPSGSDVRRRSGRPGSGRAFLAVLSLVVGVLVAACSSEATLQPTASAPPTSSTVPSPTLTPETTDPATSEPTPSPTAETTDPGEPTPSPTPATPVGADGCSGSAANRDFFAGAAAGVGWQVYCAVLPDGWFVQSGTYRLSGGGSLRIAYVGPGGARFELREGAICASDPVCDPSGTDLGAASFGDREGRLVALDAGGLALVVDGGASLSLVAYGMSLEEDAFVALTGALLPVAP